MASKLTTLARQKSAAQLQLMSRESTQWLMKKIAGIKNNSTVATSIRNEKSRQVDRFFRGGMYFFVYDPKLKHQLPYYDKFPLVLILERYEDGFLGLNLHYLPLKYRVAFLDKLLPFADMENENDIRRVRVTYDILNASRAFREFKPCIKRYLNTQIKSRILQVQSNEWEVATFLPVHQFKGEKAKVVWEESLDQVRNS
jgi:hypothetical protein